MESWSAEITKTIDEKLEGVKDSDINFFRIKEFKRNVERVESFAPNCPYCSSVKIDISEVVRTIDEAVKVPGKARREYDRLIDQLGTHMRKVHGFYPPFYYSYVYALIGLIAGFALGFILMKINPTNTWEMYIVGISLGLVVSYVLGNIKDRQVRENKKIM